MPMRPTLVSKIQLLVLAAAFGTGTITKAQDQTPPAETQAAQSAVEPDEKPTVKPDPDRPLPDIATLMREVGAHQKAEEEIRKNYLYHAIESRQERDGNGTIKKTITNEYDVFWVNGVPVQKLVKKNGKDLTADEQKKESERIDKDVARARERKDKAEAKGKDSSPRGNDTITASRILELGAFSNPRRLTLDGRDTITVDYAGDPKVKTNSRFEEVFRDLVGTVWVDEQDRVIRKTEGHFVNSYKIGGGLLVNVRKDTSFGFEQRKVNGEVWLPARFEGNGAVRLLLLVNINGIVSYQMSNYRKFKTTSTMLPEVNKVEEGGPPTPPQ
jgi:hypothetical protein